MNDFENAGSDDDGDDVNEVVIKWRHDWKQLFSEGEIANRTIQIAPLRHYPPCHRQHYFVSEAHRNLLLEIAIDVFRLISV